jgi:hypothetical protein
MRIFKNFLILVPFLLVIFSPNTAVAQRRVALVVGVNNYQKAGLSDLSYAVEDALALEKVLGDQNFEVVKVVGDDAKGEKLRSTLSGYYDRLKELKKDDVSLLFLAGHGVLRETLAPQNNNAEKKSFNQPYFCPVDANVHDAKTLIDINQIIEGIVQSGTENNLLLIDACRNAVARSAIGFKDSSISIPSKIAIIYAAEYGKSSFESHLIKHGVFTHFLLEGLQGQAAGKDGKITLLSLANYVTKELEAHSEDIIVKSGGGKQKQVANSIMNANGNPVLGNIRAHLGDSLHRPVSLKDAVDLITTDIKVWMKQQSTSASSKSGVTERLKVGRFVSETNSDVNFEHGIVELFRTSLGADLANSNQLTAKTLKGNYEVKVSEYFSGPIRPLLVLRVDVVDQNLEVLKTFKREIDDPVDISRVVGASVVTKPTDKPSSKAITLLTSFQAPDVGIRENSTHQIVHKANDKMSVEIRKKRSKSNDAMKPVDLQIVDGSPYIQLNPGDTFEILCRNHDGINPVLVKVFIDGLEVINAFNEDKLTYSGYVLPAQAESEPTPLGIPGWLRTTKRSTENAYRFSTVDLGEGSANAKKSLSNVGVITFQFHEPLDVNRGNGLSPDVEIDKGEAIDVKMTTENFEAHRDPSVTISIRYRSQI